MLLTAMKQVVLQLRKVKKGMAELITDTKENNVAQLQVQATTDPGIMPSSNLSSKLSIGS
jgi:hypothetical protein